MVRILERKESGSIDKVDTSKESGRTGMKIRIINESATQEATELQEVVMLLADAIVRLAQMDTGHDKFEVAVSMIEQLQRAHKQHG